MRGTALVSTKGIIKSNPASVSESSIICYRTCISVLVSLSLCASLSRVLSFLPLSRKTFANTTHKTSQHKNECSSHQHSYYCHVDDDRCILGCRFQFQRRCEPRTVWSFLVFERAWPFGTVWARYVCVKCRHGPIPPMLGWMNFSYSS